mmetsp:Transcript_4227/g.9680  ORF Transcript_4227/g.9680 Transcript_4227/m.9680 type:complete len:509 (-) Transcript_4227:102-1628(-)
MGPALRGAVLGAAICCFGAALRAKDTGTHSAALTAHGMDWDSAALRAWDEQDDALLQAIRDLPSLVWFAPLMLNHGYSSEAISFIIGLKNRLGNEGPRLGVRQFAEKANSRVRKDLPKDVRDDLSRLQRAGTGREGWDVAVCHSTPDHLFAGRILCPPRRSRWVVGRTMFETDRLPAQWVPLINALDEVWVTSQFAVKQFSDSGVNRSRIFVMPEAVDVDFYNPSKYENPAGDGNGLFRFLSVFKWEKRKGWDILLRAYFQEFSFNDNVTLIIKTQEYGESDQSSILSQVDHYINGINSSRIPRARYSLRMDDIALQDLPLLYKMANAFVLPTRGEGWGRPTVEAMSMGLPVITTNWGGATEYLSKESSLPLNIDGLTDVEHGTLGWGEGHRWAEPSVTHLQKLMRWAVEHPGQARDLGANARKLMVAKYSPRAVAAQHMLPRLKAIKSQLPTSDGWSHAPAAGVEARRQAGLPVNSRGEPQYIEHTNRRSWRSGAAPPTPEANDDFT